MRSVLQGMRRRLSLPLITATFVITAFMASTSLASAGEVVIGLPPTPPPPTLDLDLTAPDDDDQPDPTPPTGPDDFTNGDDPDPTPPTGPDDFTNGDGGEPTDHPAPDADQAEPQTFDATAPLASVSALPSTGAGEALNQGPSHVAPVFAGLAAVCLLATRLLPTHPGARNHTRHH